MKTFTSEEMAAIGKLRDYAVRTSPQDDPFLYYLPQLFTQRKIPVYLLPSTVTLVEAYFSGARPIFLTDAINVLNQLVDREDGEFRNPTPDIFFDNRTFVWNELGGRQDAVSAIMHIVNKVALRLSLGEKT